MFQSLRGVSFWDVLKNWSLLSTALQTPEKENKNVPVCTMEHFLCITQ